MKSFLVDQDGYYGEFGGAYVPEILRFFVKFGGTSSIVNK